MRFVDLRMHWGWNTVLHIKVCALSPLPLTLIPGRCFHLTVCGKCQLQNWTIFNFHNDNKCSPVLCHRPPLPILLHVIFSRVVIMCTRTHTQNKWGIKSSNLSLRLAFELIFQLSVRMYISMIKNLPQAGNLMGKIIEVNWKGFDIRFLASNKHHPPTASPTSNYLRQSKFKEAAHHYR